MIDTALLSDKTTNIPLAIPVAEQNTPDEWRSYRPLSLLAVGSLLLSFASLVAFADWLLLSVSVIASLFALFVYFRIKPLQEFVRGQGLSLASACIAAAITLLAATSHTIEYATEVPDGYQRLSYEKLQQDPRDLAAWEQTLQELDGKQVFIKGYAFPGAQKEDINLFMLCRDKGDCCFGGNPKITERILIKLNHPIDYTDRLQKFSGTFRYKPTQISVQTANGGDVWYILEGAVKR